MFDIHFNDIKLYPEKLAEVGTMAYPLDYMSPKLPPFGDVEWDAFVCALTDIHYEVYAVIEIKKPFTNVVSNENIINDK